MIILLLETLYAHTNAHCLIHDFLIEYHSQYFVINLPHEPEFGRRYPFIAWSTNPLFILLIYFIFECEIICKTILALIFSSYRMGIHEAML